jgi:putative ABC transport system permease protein
VLLRPLPYRDSARLVMIWEKNPVFKGFLAERLPVAGRNYAEWKRQARSFSGMAAMQEARFQLTGTDKPEELRAVRTTPDFIPLLGRSALAGRLFLPEEAVAGKDHVVLLSYAFFRRRFAADPRFVGRSIGLNGKSCTVIGVLPADFHLPALFQGMDVRRPDIWLPMSEVFTADNENNRVNYVVARLRDGASLQQARAEMSVLARGLEKEYPKIDTGFSTSVFPLSVEDVSPATGRTVLALQVAVGFVLLIACANVANLLLARAAGRSREMAIRAALGATRGRLMRQALGESALLSAAGGALGLLLAVGAMAAIKALAPEDNYHFHEVGLNWTVLAFGTGLAAVCGIFFGLAPALSASAANLQETLAQDGRAGIGRGARRLRTSLVVSEVALALILLAGAGLMLRSLRNVLGVNPGFQSAHVLSMHVRLPDDRYANDEQVRAFSDRLLERVAQLGGVESAGISSGLPLLDNLSVTTFEIQGEPPREAEETPETDVKTVSEDYFRTIGTPILRGRGFTRQDAAGPDSKVVILTESLARQIFPNRESLGRVLVIGGSRHGTAATVVGIVPDTHEMGLDTPPRPEMFLPSRAISEMALVVRTKGDPMALARSVSAQVAAIDKDQPVVDVKPLAEHLHGATQQRRFDTLLFAGFAGLALLLAAVGLYGVLSYSVTLRTREIGVRMALGAQSGDVVRLILRNGLTMTLAGTLLGGAGAWALTQLMQSLVFGVSASDPLTLAAVAAMLLLVAAGASYVPARRASRMDPTRALRVE